MKASDEILLITGDEIQSLFESAEEELLNIVKAAYIAHSNGESSLPQSSFLRFPGNDKDRIIALPAYLGGEFHITGIKWIASFPGNIRNGLDRASAVIVLNSVKTGRPCAILEGSVISAVRTGASAALAAKYLHNCNRFESIGIIGCGPINFQIVRFLSAVYPDTCALYIYDIDREWAGFFKSKCLREFKYHVDILNNIDDVLRTSSLVSIATTAVQPHIFDISGCIPGTVILNVSLRDLSVNVILECENVVDDVAHVCRAQTSVHLTEQFTGNCAFIRCTLGEILSGKAPHKTDTGSITVFSPFGLGVLDIALGKFAYELAVRNGTGTWIHSFLPAPWR